MYEINPTPTPELTQTAGQRLFPTLEDLRARMILCGIVPKVTTLLVDARVTAVDKALPPWRRQLLEACTLTPAHYSDIAKLTNADQFSAPLSMTIRNYLNSTILTLFKGVDNVLPRKFYKNDLSPVRQPNTRWKRVVADPELEHSDPNIYIPNKILLQPNQRGFKTGVGAEPDTLSTPNTYELDHARLELTKVYEELRTVASAGAGIGSLGRAQEDFHSNYDRCRELLYLKKSLEIKLVELLGRQTS